MVGRFACGGYAGEPPDRGGAPFPFSHHPSEQSSLATPGTAAGPNGPYNTHEERQRRGLGPSVANGAAGSRGCGAEGSLLQTCDLAEDRFRVPHHRGLDQLLEVVPPEAPRATAELSVARTINRARALGALRQVAEVRSRVCSETEPNTSMMTGTTECRFLTLVHTVSPLATRPQACYCAPRSSAVRWSYEVARIALESSTRALSSRVISVVISSFVRRRRSRVWLLPPAGCGSRAHT